MANIWDNVTVLFNYTNEQAIEDGIKLQLGPNLFITTNCATTLVPDYEDNLPLLLNLVSEQILFHYNAGVYDYPEGTDRYGEADQYMSLYKVRGEVVWAILDGDGLTILLPEDY